MNQEIKTKWVDTLRSGEYVQGKRRLKKNGKFCCLGVLCDLYHKETGKGEWKLLKDIIDAFDPGRKHDDPADVFLADNSKPFNSYGNESSFTVLPMDIVLWAELPNNNPNIPSLGQSLASANDAGKSFEEIATFIEKEF